MKSVTILYQTPDLIAIYKPAGLVVHSDGKTEEPTLVDWILENFPKTKNVGEPITLSSGLRAGDQIARPGIVHRLDRDTSGVMLVALTQAGFDCLKDQFKNRTILKKYHVFVYGIMSEEEGTIDRPITRSRKDFRLWSAQRGGRGESRDALTHYRVLKRSEEHQVTFVEAEPKTGRTHQIRVHFKAINRPVVADPLYAPKRDPVLGFERLALHGKQITFKNTAGEEVTVEAQYPEDFTVALSQIA
jgi:23S rRNA pseudouridine1911/1915/1917 synthase